MNEADIQKLFDEFVNEGRCLRELDTTIRSLDRTSPYYFETPRPMTPRQSEIVGKISVEMLKEKRREGAFHLIGIADAGLPLAIAIAEVLIRNGTRTSLSVIDKSGTIRALSDDLRDDDHGKEHIVLIDNAIITGRTIFRAINCAREAGYPVDTTIALFDHQVCDLPYSDFSMPKPATIDVLFLFSFKNVIHRAIELRSDRAHAYLEYAVNFGNTEIQNWAVSEIGNKGA